NEVAHLLDLAARKGVETLALRRALRAKREQLDQPRHGALDQVDRGRLERFDETRRQADRDAVAHPSLAPHPGAEADQERVAQQLALDRAAELGQGRVGLS